jgi:broad specificity phosphatase PhoE
MKLTYFVHSTSTDNEAGIRSGWNDVSLSATGLSQARLLQEHCTDRAFDAIYSSDLKRAVETAQLAFPGRKIIRDRRLREINYGALNGYPGSAFSADEFQCICTRYKSGENCLDVEDRLKDFLHDCILKFRGKSIAVVSHKYPQLALEVICNGITWHQAILNDWRKIGQWQPGWCYRVHA